MPPSAASTITGSAPSGDASAYPVTIEHRFGATVIEERPQRIVSLNVQWTDALLAMGVLPVGYLLASAAGETDLYPWQVGKLDGSQRIDSDGTLPYEQIAALDPDLILVTFAVDEQAEYDTLSAIAPTIGMLGELQVDPWQHQVEVLGAVLGDDQRAVEVIAGVESRVEAVAQEMPALAGATYTLANFVPGDGIWVIADPDDGSSRLFADLGMEIDPDIVALDPAAVGRVKISFEEIGLLDADFLAVILNGADPGTFTGLAELPAARHGTLLEMDFADIVGLNTPTPLSVPYLLELMRPTLSLVGT